MGNARAIRLTQREVGVALHVAHGETNKAIAAALQVPPALERGAAAADPERAV